MTTAASSTLAAHDEAVSRAQAAFLNRCAPGHRTWRARWSGGTTQVIELGEGPPLLLVHGGLGEAFQWGNILAPLARRHRVLAVDRPGHGLADPFDYRGVDLLGHARQFLGEIMDAVGLASAPVVANSMGGLWTLSLVMATPQRVPTLVLVGSPAGIKRELPLGLRLGTLPVLKTLVQSLMKRPTRDSVRNFSKQLLVAHPERLDDDYLDVSVASQIRNTPSWFTLIERTFTFRGMRPEFVLGERWKNLSVPTTMIWGDKDAFSPPEDGEAVVAMNPKVRLVRIPDAGHAPWLDQPAQVVEAIEAALGAASN